MCWLLLALPLSSTAFAAITSVTTNTWNVIGLDSNRPESGPNRFPVGARVCSDTGAVNQPVFFVWEDPVTPSHINLSDRGLLPDDQIFIDIPAGGCADAYFEVVVDRTSAAFDTTRGYYISASGVTTERPRELYVKKLVSQARNGIINLEYGTSLATLESVPVGGSFSLIKGETYYVRMTSYTAPGGYEQLETFSTLPNTIFQVLSVNTTYTADNTTNVSSPHDQLYADACYWEDDPNDPNYLACNGDGKIGGNMTVTYQVKIIDVLASSQPIHSLIYDLSGASYHYNSDYASGARNVFLVDPDLVTINKRFSPGTITSGGVSTLILTLTNPNGGAVSGVNVSDDLTSVVVTPAGGVMTVADSLVVTNTCGGTLLDSFGADLAAGATGLTLTGASVPGYGSCSILLQVTADLEGTYENTANLSIGDFSTSAVATLTVDDNSVPPPMPPSACPGNEVTLASWNFDTDSNGVAIPAGANSSPAYTSIDADVATALASLHGTRLTTSNISTTQSVSAPNSWAAGGTTGNNLTGWPNNGGGGTPQELPPGPTDSAYQFALDTSMYGGVRIRFQGRRTNDWTGTNNYVRIHESADGGASWTTTEITGLSSNNWTAYGRTAATTGAETTIFRINAYYRANNKAEALMYLDDVIIDGCANVPTDPPTITKAFAPATIAVGGTSTLTFTITDLAADGQALSGVSFTDELPANLTVASPLVTANTCGGSLEDAAGGVLAGGDTGLRLTDGSLANGASCQVSVNVSASSAGVYDNVSGYVTSLYSGANTDPATGIAQATLTALLPPTIDKSFAPDQIFTTAFSGVSTLTFTITNPNPSHEIVGVAFSDDFPGAAPGDVVVADPPNATTSNCGTPVYAPVAGSGSIAFSGGSIAAGGVCTVTVDVESATAGYFENTSGAVSHLLDDAVLGTNYAFGTDTASANLLVSAPQPAISLLKQVGPSATGPWGSGLVVAAGAEVYYRFIVENIGNVELTGVTVIENPDTAWIDLTGCSWADGDGDPLTAPFTLPEAGANDIPPATIYNDHIAVCISGTPVIAQSGTHPNTAYARGTYNSVDYPSDNSTATYATSDLALLKSATDTFFIQAGDILTYTYAVSNSGSSLAGPVTVSDNRIAGVVCPALTTIGNNDTNLDNGETLICTGSYTVTATDVSNRQVNNIARAVVDGVYSPTDSASVAIGAPLLTILKSANLANANPGDTIVYTVQIHNTGNGLATSVVLKDRLSPYGAFKLDFDDSAPIEPFLFTDTTPAPAVSGLTLGTPEYSDDNGATEPWGYSLVDRGDGHDDNLTNWRIPMGGALNAGGSISLQYKVIVK